MSQEIPTTTAVTSYLNKGASDLNTTFIINSVLRTGASFHILTDGIRSLNCPSMFAQNVAETIAYFLQTNCQYFAPSNLFIQAVKFTNEVMTSKRRCFRNLPMGCSISAVIIANGFAHILTIGSCHTHILSQGTLIHSSSGTLEDGKPQSYLNASPTFPTPTILTISTSAADTIILTTAGFDSHFPITTAQNYDVSQQSELDTQAASLPKASAFVRINLS